MDGGEGVRKDARPLRIGGCSLAIYVGIRAASVCHGGPIVHGLPGLDTP